jgi:hypothetical protein
MDCYTPKERKRIGLYPIFLIQIYLSASLLMFAFGPWPWPVTNPVELYSFLILAQLALLAGYLMAIKKRPRPAATKLRVPTLVTVSLLFSYLWLGQIYEFRTGEPFNLQSASAAAISGLSNPGLQYLKKQLNVSVVTGEPTSLMNYASLPVFAVLWIAFPLGVVFWKQLSAPIRIAFVGYVVLDLLSWAASGMNKGIFDYVIMLPCLLVARKPAILLNIRRNLAVFGLAAIVAVSAVFAFFSIGLAGRFGGSPVPLYDQEIGIESNFENSVLRIVPPTMQPPIAFLVSDFTQGYYALSLSLKQPFVFCYGVGNSFFLEGLSRHVFDKPLFDSTYPARIESSGWSTYGRWHSIYPWIASDLTFPGTIVFMFLLGWVFALVWLDVAFSKNLWAVCLFPLLLIMLFYVPANNQVLAFSPQAVPFWAMLFLWLFTRGTNRTKKVVNAS